jgi:hypothetical protein
MMSGRSSDVELQSEEKKRKKQKAVIDELPRKNG